MTLRSSRKAIGVFLAFGLAEVAAYQAAFGAYGLTCVAAYVHFLLAKAP
ncbi:hypothetical protein [Rhodoferax saidenbachensis]|uniref:Uncharacterized protein n=1 Tax=Rhodoferax saidenbachensis TaxID=1484693 RepID=A0ABU1ZMV0_9BURK|nr:hypothetical protein [Rhodoferax saidenbachensis]MDR7306867.1 hypothetical protein [Rhodoferax saidenbachensis]